MAPHPAFCLLRTERIASLSIEVQHFRHLKTGADHYHLAADKPENVFLVALRTMPQDSSGVAHILEHTVLCGSEKYPVRDPFFMMIRRSLNTFMNAFTSSDWTAYPFASQNRKDFFNLLDVYLDAVFFSRLHELDFRQEGHRLEFTDTSSKTLEYKGVVYNEMKGAMSSPASILWQTLTRYLYPTTTYHHNSGGEPEHIPDLSYEQLKAFYRVHYHPSNAVFMTYGDIPAAELQARFEQNALCRFDCLEERIEVPDEKRYYAPVRVEEYYAADPNGDDEPKTHIVLGWLLGNSTDLNQRMRAELLASLLLENSASPLRKALETTDLGTAPSPLCGVDDSCREMSFMCGLEGCDPARVGEVEALIFSVLREVAERGVPQEDLEASLDQLELEQREVGGDGYPYGLQIILAGLNSAIHRGDPIALLNLDPVIEALRVEIKRPDFVKNLIHEFVLTNNHWVRLTLIPEGALNQRREAAMQQKLATLAQSLSLAQSQHIVNQAAALLQRQGEVDNIEILPKVGIADVPAEIKTPSGTLLKFPHGPLHHYAQGTNGLIYEQVIVELPELSAAEIDLLPLYASLLAEVGAGKVDYLEMQKRQTRVTGGVGAFSSIRSELGGLTRLQAYFSVSSKCLVRYFDAMTDVLQQVFHNARFDETKRIRELISQRRARKEASIVDSGHSYAMSAATAGLSPLGSLMQRHKGLSAIAYLKTLDQQLKKSADEFLAGLCSLHRKITAQNKRFLIVAEAEHSPGLLEPLTRHWRSNEATPVSKASFQYDFVPRPVQEIWVTNTQVHFSSKAYATVPATHPDAAPLTVLGGFLRNGYLHRAIREQGGAYGGGASHDAGVGAFRFYSYRDPRLLETLADFDRSLEWLASSSHEWRPVEEAILGVVGSLDKPGSPAGEAKDAFYNSLHGRTPEQRAQFRTQVLNVTLKDLQRVAATYLTPDKAQVAVVTHAEGRRLLATDAYEVHEV